MSPSTTSINKQGNNASGFTLIEVLVSFLILAMFLGVMYQTFSSGLKSVGRTEQYSTAIMQAESLLATAGVSRPLEEGGVEGEFPDGHRWRITATPIADTGQTRKNSPVAHDVTVLVSWGSAGKEHTVGLRTIKWGTGQ